MIQPSLQTTAAPLSAPFRSRLRWCAVALAVAAAPVPAPAATVSKTRQPCCLLRAGTPVEIELVDRLSTKVQRRGDTFALRLASPVVVNGMVVLRAGTPGVGEVIDAARPGIGGKPGTMVLAVKYLEVAKTRVPLNALHLAGRGHDNSTPATVLEVAGIASVAAGLAGVVLPGGDVAFNPGARAGAQVASDMRLPPEARASRRALAAAAAVNARAAAQIAREAEAAIPIPAPPPGMGQVVFFRAKSLLGTAQWFNVRENGLALGRLDNGSYFIKPEPPGVHTFTAKLEPELKDRLKLQVDPGQTYFVEGTLTAGLVISAADLVPSTIDRFDAAAKRLTLAARPAQAEEERRSDRSPAEPADVAAAQDQQPPK